MFSKSGPFQSLSVLYWDIIWKSRGGRVSFFGHPGLVQRDFFHCCQTQPVPREYHTQCYVVEVQTLVELNPNILVRRFQRMAHLKVILP